MQSLAESVKIHRFTSLPSTNAWLLQQGKCGDVCLADTQTAGRGRRGRSWQSPPGANLYVSLRWCFAEVPPQYGLLSLVTGLAVAETLAQHGIEGHGIKWPNDIYYQGRKLGGILLQTAQPLREVVIGIGLNVNMLPQQAEGIDQPWVSLAMIRGEPLDREQLLQALLAQLVPRLQRFPALDQTSFQAQWQPWDVLAGQAVTVHLAETTLQGTALGIDGQGQFRVALDNGDVKVFSAADVSIRL